MLITNARTGTHAPHAPTPGPWHAQGRYIVPADNGPSIGSAIALKAPSLKKQPDYDAQAHINARLMAAAPDMLDLLYCVLPIVEDAGLDPCYKPGAMAAIERQIRDLIDNLERPI